MARRHTVVLYIAGQRYAIKTDADPTYLRQLAAFVDEQYQTLSDGSRPGSPQKVTLLTALRIADELFKERATTKTLKKNIRLKSNKILDIIDTQLVGNEVSDKPKKKQ